MKISTLHKIARNIANELRVNPKMSVNQMTAELKRVAGNCRTKSDAEKQIRVEIFND